jgi:hypothetical protein
MKRRVEPHEHEAIGKFEREQRERERTPKPEWSRSERTQTRGEQVERRGRCDPHRERKPEPHRECAQQAAATDTVSRDREQHAE